MANTTLTDLKFIDKENIYDERFYSEVGSYLEKFYNLSGYKFVYKGNNTYHIGQRYNHYKFLDFLDSLYIDGIGSTRLLVQKYTRCEDGTCEIIHNISTEMTEQEIPEYLDAEYSDNEDLHE